MTKCQVRNITCEFDDRFLTLYGLCEKYNVSVVDSTNMLVSCSYHYSTSINGKTCIHEVIRYITLSKKDEHTSFNISTGLVYYGHVHKSEWADPTWTTFIDAMQQMKKRDKWNKQLREFKLTCLYVRCKSIAAQRSLTVDDFIFNVVKIEDIKKLPQDIQDEYLQILKDHQA